MSRASATHELSRLILELQQLCQRGESLARASGGLVDPLHFRAALAAAVGAAGDLDRKGLLVQPTERSEAAP